jgi:hypothetical protein
MAARPSDNKPQTGRLPHFPQTAGGRADRVAPVFFFPGFPPHLEKDPSSFLSPAYLEHRAISSQCILWPLLCAQLVRITREEKPSALIAC